MYGRLPHGLKRRSLQLPASTVQEREQLLSYIGKQMEPLAREEGVEKNIIPVSPYTAIIRNKYSDLFIRLIFNEERGIYAMAYGSRLIPKSK